MCEFFVNADPILYEQRSRTVRIHGVLTSLRLENMMWDTLAEMAAEEGRTTNALISTFHDEVLAHRGEVPNFASFLRVTCMRYLRRRLLASETPPRIVGPAPTSAVSAASAASAMVRPLAVATSR
ncbi:ribbon-helix-helix domain-containing protein [Variovorax sp. PAMC28562]|uniref:ribbon-helix-helix domain-containing protein n=1 Tax=Variovorax sp. PAMC28562 TaxID=2762323 RepID=UPI00164EC98F|nr:ribbon-helix-helix domain-containing protein [Variovorax sp. PAMC28562]QNK72470.1 ribbon-helix-helix domain-containing protein [Variovorax sp. PAMC28562]